MFGWIGAYIEKKAIEWLAGKIGVTPEWLSKVIGDLIAFIQEIIKYLGKEGAQLHFQKVARVLHNARDEKKAVQKLMNLQEEIL